MTRVRRVAFLTSAPFACGLAWLVNAMLALGHRTTSLLYEKNHWEDVGDGEYRVGEAARKHIVHHLPILLERERHRFIPEIELFWEHRVRFDIDPACPVVVVVRDPRDAIFSLHRRWKMNGWYPGELPEFLDWRTDWPDHFPGLFWLDAVKTYLLFHLRWLHASRVRPIRFVRFEDLKERPEETLAGVLAFLGSRHRDDACIRRAIASSSTERARDMLARRMPGGSMQAIHRGRSFEWKERNDPVELAHYDGALMRAFLRWMGYEADESHLDGWLQRAARRPIVDLRTLVQRRVFVRPHDAAGAPMLWQEPSGRIERRLDTRCTPVRQHRIAENWAYAVAETSAEVPALHSFFAAVCRMLLEPDEIEWLYERTVRHPRWGVNPIA